jgi:hypothetical protein
MGFLFAQCDQNSVTERGTIRGIASPCVGPNTNTAYGTLSVTVYLTKEGRAVAQQSVQGAHRYQFVVAAGHYVVATQEGEGSKPVGVTVRPGKFAHANIPSFCK